MSRRRKILIVAGIVFGVAILIPVIRHYQLRFAVENYIAELKARGEPMDLAQVIPPPVPPEQNSADTFRNAFALFDADKSLLQTNSYSAMKMVAPGKAMIGWQQPDVRGYEATNSWRDVTAAVVQDAKGLALIEQIMDKPNFDFQIKYKEGIEGLEFTNFYLEESKLAAQRLEAAALCALHQGDTAAAVKNLRVMLVIVTAMRNERLVISELVRMAIANIALTVNWEILQSPNLTDEQLAELQRDWTSLEFIRAEENALAMERVTGQISAKKWRSFPSELQHYLESWIYDWTESGTHYRAATTFEKIDIKVKVFMWHYWWSYADELRMLKGYQILLETARIAETNYSLLPIINDQKEKFEKSGVNKFGSYWDVWEELIDHDFDVHRMLSGSAIGLSYAFYKVMRVEAAKQMMATAIALKRYQLKHRNYPADLNLLLPEFISTVPLDPVDGEPLRYRPNADGTFLLYSIGENGVDDGGNPSLEKGVTGSNSYWQNLHALDWVWPQLATEEEIQDYYKKLSSQKN